MALGWRAETFALAVVACHIRIVLWFPAYRAAPMGVALPMAAGICSVALFFATMWAVTPTEQALPNGFNTHRVWPNAVYFHAPALEVTPVATPDNTTMPPHEVSSLSGLYGYQMLFYHRTLERFVKSEQRANVQIWSCVLGCQGTHGGTPALIHWNEGPKSNVWYVVEFVEEDANSPVLYMRSKRRAKPTMDVPFVTVADWNDEKLKAEPVPGVYFWSLWDLFSTWPGIGTVVAIAVGLVFALTRMCKATDDDDD